MKDTSHSLCPVVKYNKKRLCGIGAEGVSDKDIRVTLVICGVYAKYAILN